MIILYTGTPGSGKSLDVARQILVKLRLGHNFIGNMLINKKALSGLKGKYMYVDTYSLDPDELMQYAKKYHVHGKEHQTVIVIDECQQIFNSRDWQRPIMKKWNSFFQVHRHYGFDVYLITQYDRLIDRQVRSLVELERIHRKIENMGLKGKFLTWSFGCNSKKPLFITVEQHYQLKIKTDSYFFKFKKKYAEFYDSYSSFDLNVESHDDLKPLLCPDAHEGQGFPRAAGQTAGALAPVQPLL